MPVSGKLEPGMQATTNAGTRNPEHRGQERWNPGRQGQERWNPGRQGQEHRNPGRQGQEHRNPGRQGQEHRNSGTSGSGTQEPGSQGKKHSGTWNQGSGAQETSRYPESRNPRPSQRAARATGRYLEPVEANAIQEKPGCPKPELVRITCVSKLTRNEQSQGPVTRNLEKLRKFVGEALYVGETRIS